MHSRLATVIWCEEFLLCFRFLVLLICCYLLGCVCFVGFFFLLLISFFLCFILHTHTHSHITYTMCVCVRAHIQLHTHTHTYIYIYIYFFFLYAFSVCFGFSVFCVCFFRGELFVVLVLVFALDHLLKCGMLWEPVMNAENSLQFLCSHQYEPCFKKSVLIHSWLLWICL